MADVLRRVIADTPTASPAPAPATAPPSTTPAATASAAPVGAIWPQVVSSSVWAGGDSPVILALFDDTGAR